jgi:hypothetical protein
MKFRINSTRRIAAVAAVACAALIAPAIALAAPASPSRPAAPATPACETAGLVVWLNTEGNGYAGGSVYTLNFTNLPATAAR